MIKYYKTFEFNYDRHKLLELFHASTKVRKLAYAMAEDLPANILPCINILGRELSKDEYGLAELLVETGLHTNPKNNGLIVFPVSGVIQFDFLECKIDVTEPVMINGRTVHNYLPLVSPSIFFAIKIPSDITWEQVIKLL